MTQLHSARPPADPTELSQGEYALAVRGGRVRPGTQPTVPGHVLGMTNTARAAVRRTHREGPDAARDALNAGLAKWRQAGGPAAATAETYARRFEQYLQWDDDADLLVDGVDVKATVLVGRHTRVRAIAHAVAVAADGRLRPRMVLWDSRPCDHACAEMIAVPVLAVISASRPTAIAAVDVWQLSSSRRFAVGAAAVIRRTADAEARVLSNVETGG